VAQVQARLGQPLGQRLMRIAEHTDSLRRRGACSLIRNPPDCV
jgi:hypothetical protein